VSVYIPGLVDELIDRLRELGCRVEFVSRRMGHEILLIERGDRRVLLWLRSSLVNRRALDLFNRITKDFEYDTVVVTKKSVHANPARLPENWIVVDLSSVKSDDEALSRILDAVKQALGE